MGILPRNKRDLISLIFLTIHLHLYPIQISSKILTQCEFIDVLNSSNISNLDWGKWICVADLKSKFNTSSKGKSSSFLTNPDCIGDLNGIFQISNEYCEDDGNKEECQNNPCELQCNYLLNDDIQDDIDCAQKLIYKYNLITASKFFQKCEGALTSFYLDGLNCKENDTQRKTSSTEQSSVTIIAIIVSVVLIVFGIILVVIAQRRWNIKHNGLSVKEIYEFKHGRVSQHKKLYGNRTTTVISSSLTEPPEDSFSFNPYNKQFEIPLSEYEIETEEVLGSGAFGIVLKGKVRNQIVAVKTVKPNADKEYVISLLEEIKVMTYLGKHENIMGFIGASTKNLSKGNVYVFVEFCALGSLEKYLKSGRDTFINEIVEDEFLCSVYETENRGSRYVPHCTQMDPPISSKDLISWAYQISKGMQFLESKKVVHADLACRNVLLASRNSIKISDFGLSRKLYSYCNYFKTKEEPLPWRWMSIESLRDMNFSSKSDVWAFGVTLWEIFSLADVPFPGLAWSVNFVEELINGLRMGKPRFSTTSLYEITMVQSWCENPDSRPTFESLSHFLHSLLERVSSSGYENILQDVCAKNDPHSIKQ